MGPASDRQLGGAGAGKGASEMIRPSLASAKTPGKNERPPPPCRRLGLPMRQEGEMGNETESKTK